MWHYISRLSRQSKLRQTGAVFRKSTEIKILSPLRYNVLKIFYLWYSEKYFRKILTNINERMPCAPIPEAASNKRPFMSFAYINTIKLMVWCHETERDIAHQCLSARLIAFDAHMCKKLNARFFFARNAMGLGAYVWR